MTYAGSATARDSELNGTPVFVLYLKGLKRLNGSSVFSWVDGTPLDFSLWKEDEPDEPEKYCARLESNGEWRDAPCDLTKAFPCEKGK